MHYVIKLTNGEEWEVPAEQSFQVLVGTTRQMGAEREMKAPEMKELLSQLDDRGYRVHALRFKRESSKGQTVYRVVETVTEAS